MVNKWFQFGNGPGDKEDQDLYQSQVNEVIQMGGIDFVYLPRTFVKLDNILNEDALEKFEKSYTLEMFLESNEEFDGPGLFVGTFGTVDSSAMRVSISSERFRIVTGMDLPKEGDWIFYPGTRILFEVKFVNVKTPILPLGFKPYWILTCEQVKHSYEDIDTGTAIDDLNVQYANNGDDIIGDPFKKNTTIEAEAEDMIDNTEQYPWGRT